MRRRSLDKLARGVGQALRLRLLPSPVQERRGRLEDLSVPTLSLQRSKAKYLASEEGTSTLYYINFFSLPSSELVPGTNWVCPWDKLGFHCENLGLSPEQHGFVQGTNWVCPWDKPGVVPRATGPKSLCSCAFLLPEYSHDLVTWCTFVY